MSNDPEHPRNSAAELSEEELFARLEEYTAALQAGDRATCEGLLESTPELSDYVECLGDLNAMAPAKPSASSQESKKLAEMFQPTISSNSGSSLGSSMLQPSQTFGKFEIQEELGRGGMGVVFRARQTDLKRDVAVKVIRTHQLANEEELRRFEIEAQAAARLQHPNIVAVHECGEIDGLQYFAMDFIFGENLSDRLNRGPFPFEEAASMMVPVAEAVAYLHEHNVLHRDLKPSNILIDEEEQPHVTDFGLARISDDDGSVQTRTGLILGTPSYMSPEQAAGRHKLIDHRTDIYSLGAILYEMLTGQPPFKEDNALDTIVQVIEQEPQLPRRLRPGIPRDLELICLKCLEKEPDRRYASADELAKDLARYLKGDHVTASAPSIFNRFYRWARRNPAASSRWAGVLAATSIIQTRATFFEVVDLPYHYEVLTVFAVWAVVIGLFQFLTLNKRIKPYLEYAWAATDAMLMTFVLLKVPGDLGPLVIGYPMIVASSGMFFNVRVVVCSAIFSCLGYICLWIWNPGEHLIEAHYRIIYLIVLVLLGVITAHQVRRVRVLSQYYEAGD